MLKEKKISIKIRLSFHTAKLLENLIFAIFGGSALLIILVEEKKVTLEAFLSVVKVVL